MKRNQITLWYFLGIHSQENKEGEVAFINNFPSSNTQKISNVLLTPFAFLQGEHLTLQSSCYKCILKVAAGL